VDNLVKIRDVSSRYDISARTLRYYEDKGLISSIRSDDHAYRLYDNASINKLEQILILRKLNISVKDIKLIFDSSGSDVVLNVLEKKIEDIDGEVALLHELKDIVLEFVSHIKQLDFSKESDVKLLYDKTKEIETSLINVDYAGNPASINRLLEVTEKLDKKVPDVMIIKIPNFRALTSGLVSWDEIFGAFEEWSNARSHFFKSVIFDCADFLTGKDGKAEWFVGVNDEVMDADVEPYKIVEFHGGLYAVTVSVDGDGESHNKVRAKVDKWLETTNFIEDESRAKMGHMIYPHDDIMKGLGYHQMNLYLPIKLKEDCE